MIGHGSDAPRPANRSGSFRSSAPGKGRRCTPAGRADIALFVSNDVRQAHTADVLSQPRFLLCPKTVEAAPGQDRGTLVPTPVTGQAVSTPPRSLVNPVATQAPRERRGWYAGVRRQGDRFLRNGRKDKRIQRRVLPLRKDYPLSVATAYSSGSRQRETLQVDLTPSPRAREIGRGEPPRQNGCEPAPA